MRDKIKNTQTYKSLNDMAKVMIRKHTSFIQIQDSVIQARNIGLDKWKAQTGLPNNWKGIVEEIVTTEKSI